jgi:methyltransferase family protein
MLAASRRRLIDSLPHDAVVLDIGGWADPFNRADWVMDMMPYQSRGLYERSGWIERRDTEPQRFSESTWIERDICDREPYPFGDGELDFVICSHTLEDVRDPVWVCGEMTRIAKGGYIEVPSVLEELSYGFRGSLVGWEHHRWLIEIDQEERRVDFTFKEHGLHTRADAHFPAGFRDRLSEEDLVSTLWWEGDFSAAERVFVGTSLVEGYVVDVVRRGLAQHAAPEQAGPREGGRLRRLLGRMTQRQRQAL